MSMFSKVKHGQEEYQVKCWDNRRDYDVGDKVGPIDELSTYGVLTLEGPVIVVMSGTYITIMGKCLVPPCLKLFNKWGYEYEPE